MSFSIVGTGRAVPSTVKTNDDLSLLVDTSDEWITTRTGIKSRHICTEETLTQLSYEAAAAALNDAGVRADELDLIICATLRGDYIVPSLACLLQKRLGATCPAFDINAACSGFIYALDVAAGYFARGRAGKILVVGAEAMSRLLDWKDRSTCVLFGDGAGAVVLSAGDDLLAIKLSAQGDNEVLAVSGVAGDCPFAPAQDALPPRLLMKGKDVYRFAVTAIVHDLKEVMEEAGLKEEEIDWILLHQANLRIIEAAQGRLNIPEEKYVTNIQNYGNTSAASIPILLDEFREKGSLKPGDILAMSAFGGGLTTGACIIRWSKG